LAIYVLFLFLLLFGYPLYVFYFYLDEKVIFLQFASFKITSFLLVLQILLIIASIFIFITSLQYSLLHSILHIEIDALFLFAIFGVLLLIVANDMILVYTLIELQSLPFYAALSIFGEQINAIDSSLKYFIMSILASAILLFGMAVLYYSTGLTNFEDLSLFFFLKYSSSGIITVHSFDVYSLFTYRLAALLIIIALLFKLTAAPFHYWVIDIYDASPLLPVLLLTTVAKTSIIVLFNNVYNFIFSVPLILTFLKPLLFLIAIVTLVIGTLGAYNASKIAIILGYGGIAHIGFIIVAIAINATLSLFLAIFYFMSYVFTSLTFFIAWFSFSYKECTALYIKQFVNLSSIFRGITVCLTLACLSFAGLPPLVGFVGKLLILYSLIEMHYSTFILLFFVLSVLSSAYYLRFIKALWFDSEADKFSWYSYLSMLTVSQFICLTLLSIFLVGGVSFILIV